MPFVDRYGFLLLVLVLACVSICRSLLFAALLLLFLVFEKELKPKQANAFC